MGKGPSCRNEGLGGRRTQPKKELYSFAFYLPVSIDDLARRISELAERARKYADVFRRSEAATRASLIEPFLRLWGWNTEDPAQVRPEFPTQSGRPDYALLGDDGRPLMFVGAKPYGRQGDLMQYISYCVSEGVGYFVATDGVVWEVYDTHERKPLQEKLVARWDILNDPPVEVLRKSFVIARGVLVPPPPPPPPPNGLRLDEINPKEVKPPFSVIFPDGQRYDVKAWRDLLVSVIEWLIKTGRLTEKQLPLKHPRATKRYIVNTKSVHLTGSPFTAPKQVLNVYVETGTGPTRIKQWSCYALSECGVDPNQVFVEVRS